MPIIIERHDLEDEIPLTPALLDIILAAEAHMLTDHPSSSTGEGLDFEGGTYTNPSPTLVSVGTYAAPGVLDIQTGSF
jgi:hypothetical protein